MSALLRHARWYPAARVLLLLLAAQPAVAAVVSSASVRWPLVAVVVAVVEALIGTLPVNVTSEPAKPADAAPPGKAAP